MQLPPPPRYESYPGEAAQVKKVLDSIEQHKHTAAPLPQPVPATAPPSDPDRPVYPDLPGYPATLTVTNDTDCRLGVYLGGVIFRGFGLVAGASATLEMVAGTYLFGIDTHRCAEKMPPLLGQAVFAPGSRYTLTLSREDVQPKFGQVLIENNTGAELAVTVDATTHTLPAGSFSLDLSEGSYTAAVSARCGRRLDVVDIGWRTTYTAKYWCADGAVVTRPPQVGYFEVRNNTGAMLTIVVAGTTHTMPTGSTTIELPAGSYTAVVSTTCGSATEALEVQEGGSQYVGTYSCATD